MSQSQTSRKGFRSIVVDGERYQYAVSLRTSKIITYDASGLRRELAMPHNEYRSDSWRGKHCAGGWGKREVADLIRNVGRHGDCEHI